MFQKQVQAIKETIKRFPLNFGLSLLALIFVLWQIELVYNDPLKDTLMKGHVMSILSFFVVYAWSVLVEARQLNLKKNLLGLGVITALMAWFYFALLSPIFNLETGHHTFILRHASIYLAVIVSVLWLPFYKNTTKDNALWRHVIYLCQNIAQAMAMGLVLMAGISAILGTVDALFNVHIDGDWYLRTFLIISHVIAPLFVLAETPTKLLEKDSEIKFTRIARFMSKYVLISLIGVYTLVVYVYLAKTLIQLAWPKYGVAELISGFIIVGISTYFLTYPERGKKNVIGVFQKKYFIVLTPMIIALWAGIGVRITEYGLTINRYLIVMFGIYSLSLLLYYTFSKEKHLQFIFINLLIALFISAYVPYINAFSFSRISQSHRLEMYIQANNPDQARSALRNIIDISNENYLSRKYELDLENPVYEEINKYLESRGLDTSYPEAEEAYVYFDHYVYEDSTVFEVEEYKTMLAVDLGDGIWDTTYKVNSEQVKLSMDKAQLSLENHFDLIDLSQEIDTILSEPYQHREHDTPLQIEGENYLLIINEIRGNQEADKNGDKYYQVNHLSGYLLLK